MQEFYSNDTKIKFIDRLKKALAKCDAFYFSVSFIKIKGLELLLDDIESALIRGAKGIIITSTYQNFTDIKTLRTLLSLQTKYPDTFECHLENNDFVCEQNVQRGFHTKGYLFEFKDDEEANKVNKEVIIGSSNITYYALLKNVEWDIAVNNSEVFDDVQHEFKSIYAKTQKLTEELIRIYTRTIEYAVVRWDMDYVIKGGNIEANSMQKSALREIVRLRAMGETRALVRAAAGTGKTYLAAFDAKGYGAKTLLYIAEESTILNRSKASFEKVLGNQFRYGLFDQKHNDFAADYLFATNISMSNNCSLFKKEHFEYIVIDECHHATSETYRRILDYFEPAFLLGITATPERMDRKDVYHLFGYNVPYDLRLRDSIILGLVVPFHYYGIRDDSLDYGNNPGGRDFLKNGSYQDLRFLIASIDKYYHDDVKGTNTNVRKLKALAFCRNINHAQWLTKHVNEDGKFVAKCLTGNSSFNEREQAYANLQDDDNELQILFTVDILNEGVDIPGVNMVLFLRPTESSTVFIQQLGRGLRRTADKDHVAVIDFIGNNYARSVQIAQALGSLSNNLVLEKNVLKKLVKDNFRSLALENYGVSISIDEKSQEEILNAIDSQNFDKLTYLKKDYENFRKFIGSESYPRHTDYLNSAAPDLLRLMFHSKKAANEDTRFSYYNFLKLINEPDAPDFTKEEAIFISEISRWLPLVRIYEYLFVSVLIENDGRMAKDELCKKVMDEIGDDFDQSSYDHAWKYFLCSLFNIDNFGNNIISFKFEIRDEFRKFVLDLIEYGIERFNLDFKNPDRGIFKLWSNYKKDQVMTLLKKDPRDKMKGTKYIEDVTYIFVTVIKGDKVQSSINYDDGYITEDTFQWESENSLSRADLNKLVNSSRAEVFVRKAKAEKGYTLPFTYVGFGKLNLIKDSLTDRGSYIFNISMHDKASQEIFFDFRRQNNVNEGLGAQL